LHETADWQPLSKAGLTALRSAAKNDEASPFVLDLVVTAFLQAEPTSLRDPQFALACAERGVTLTHRKTPSWLLSLAEAYAPRGKSRKAALRPAKGWLSCQLNNRELGNPASASFLKLRRDPAFDEVRLPLARCCLNRGSLFRCHFEP
jgi:hypothetical protein